MTHGAHGQGRSEFDSNRIRSVVETAEQAPQDAPAGVDVSTAIQRTRDYLLSAQHRDGYWVGELEGDTILESEYVLLLAYLGRGQSDHAQRAVRYIVQQQLPEGGWAIYPGGPLEISASVKSYFAMKIVGHDPHSEPMQRARRAILEAGGAEHVNSFTRFYLALLGEIGYDKCPAVPPEIILLPRWCPFNIYEMSAWSRTIVIPLSILWAFRPAVTLPPDQGIRELFRNSPEELPAVMPPSAVLNDLQKQTWIDWDKCFRRVDRLIKLLDRLRLRPFRKRALRRTERWMCERFAESDGLGAIFPPIVWSVIALRCLGYADDAPEVAGALEELRKLVISEGDADRLQPCKSPVWDTAIATIALRDAEVPAEHPAIRRAAAWLLSKEVRRKGDWSVAHPEAEPAGWYFEFNNAFYPDVDDTGMVVMALARCLPTGVWNADLLLNDWSPHEDDRDAAAIVSGKSKSAYSAVDNVQSMQPLLSSIRRGARWVFQMQGRDGGWGAFDADNTREILTRVPFADHNAMIDPSTTDLTARMLEMFAGLGVTQEDHRVRKALDFIWADQEYDYCWFGRWGVNYIYGTWQALVGLAAIGIPPGDFRIQRAAGWLKAKQQPCGGWGETPKSYDDPSLRGQGLVTASQTAWAVMGLLAAGEGNSPEVARGIQYLVRNQQPDGTWEEAPFTGTGFPRVFYLKYHLYRISFPLMALARYARHRRRAKEASV